MIDIRAIILDWDGVIVESDPFNEYAISQILKRRGLPLPNGWYRTYFFARTLKDALVDYLSGMHQPPDLIHAIRSEKKTFDTQYEDWVVAHPDAMALIARIRDTYPLAIATGSRRQPVRIGLRKFGITDAFDAIAASEDYENSKPAPDAFLTALWYLNATHGKNIKPENVLVIEDAAAGVEGAKRAKMSCVGVARENNEDELREADFIVNDLRDLDIENLTAKAQ